MAFLNDTFTDTNGTTLGAHTGELGATWTLHPSYTASALIRTNRLHGNSGTRAYYASGTPASADYDVEGVLRRISSTGNAGLAGRMDTAANTMYLITWEAAGGGQFALYKITAGTIAPALGTFADTSTGTDRTVKLQMRGTAIKVFIDGVERISVTDSDISAAGRAGVRLLNGTATTGTHIDSITASNAAATVERSAALSATGAIASAGEFFTVFERSSAVSAAGAIASAPQRDLLRSSTITATGAVQSVPQRELQRAVTVSASATIASDGYAEAERSASLSASAVIASSPQRDLLRQVAVGGVAAIASAGEIAGGFTTHERSASLSATGSVESSGVFWTTFERQAAVSASGSVESSGHRLLERSVAVTASATFTVAGEFWSTYERSAAVSATGSIASVPQRDVFRSVAVTATGSIEVTPETAAWTYGPYTGWSFGGTSGWSYNSTASATYGGTVGWSYGGTDDWSYSEEDFHATVH